MPSFVCALLTHCWQQVGPETVVCDRCGLFVRDARTPQPARQSHRLVPLAPFDFYLEVKG